MLKVVLALVIVTACCCARAEIFKCKTVEGRDLYQNFPCSIDSLGLPSNPTAGPAPDRSARPAAHASRTSRAATARGTALVSPEEPQVGMTAEQVRTLWGEPRHSYYDELVDGRVEVWAYDASRAVHFDLRKRVSAVER